MTKERKEKLLLEVAQQFTDARLPMNEEWLYENKVTMEECGFLMDSIGGIIRGFVMAPERTQLQITICSATEDKGAAEYVVAVMDRGAARRLIP